MRTDTQCRLKAAPTRQDCGCVESVDIGAYETCIFGCAYCYATNSRNSALQKIGEHDPEDTILWRPAMLRDIELTSQEYKPKHKKPAVVSPAAIQGKLFD